MNAWTAVVLSFLLAALCSGLEIAFITANKLKIELDKKSHSLFATLIIVLTRKPQLFIGTLLLGNTIAIIVFTKYLSALLDPYLVLYLPSTYSILIIKTIIVTGFLLVTAEFIPKVLFRSNPNAILKNFIVPAFVLYIFLFPFVALLIFIAEWLFMNIFRMKLSLKGYSFGPIDLDHYLREFAGHTGVEQEEKQEIQMLQNVIGFRDIVLRECMIPRPEIEGVADDETPDTINARFIETGLSKILVYSGSIDNIIGYIHVHDLFHKPESIREILMPVIFVPETMLAGNLLSRLIKEHRSLAVVVDEFGGTAGLVTMEDIIEEIFGEIRDEYDTEEEAERKISDHEFIFSARLEIDYLNEKYHLGLPVSDEFETLAGFILHTHENIPDINEMILIGKFRFTILEATESRIEKVHLHIEKE